MAGQQKHEALRRISVDRKIVEQFRSGWSTSKIAENNEKGKGYVIKVRALALEFGYIEQIADSPLFRATAKEIPPYPEALFQLTDKRSQRFIETDGILNPHQTWIIERLKVGWSLQTIFEELPIKLARSTFYRYLTRHKLHVARDDKHSPEIISAPGECLQIDWGKMFDVNGAVKTKVIWAFIGTMGHSRYTMVRLVDRCDFETTMTAITSMLNELGGVPKRITSDNPKVFVNQASEYEPLLNVGYERFASHYGFCIEALPPADPTKKGKVERTVQFARRLSESIERENFDLEDAQVRLDAKLVIANRRKHGSHRMQPIEVLLRDETPVLKCLPQMPYELEKLINTTVREDGYVRFLNKFYRVDTRLKKQEVLVIGNTDLVSIYCAGRLLEVYPRIKDPFQMKDCKDHYKESWEKTLNDHGHYIARAEKLGSNVSRFVQIILARGEGFVDTRVVWGLLTLDKNYGNDEIDKACASAIELSSVSLRTLKSLLKIHAKPKPKIETQPTGKFTRPMSEYKAQLRLVFSAT